MIARVLTTGLVAGLVAGLAVAVLQHFTTTPLILAGKGGGTLKTGRNLDYLERGNENRKAASLYLSIMDRMGVKLDRFGDADARLAAL